MRFWLTNGAITDINEAWRRCAEVGCVVLNAANDIVAVSSVYKDILNADRQAYWFYRMFVRPDCRIPGLAVKILNTTVDRLSRAYQQAPGTADAPQGIIIVTENPKLESQAGIRSLQRAGFIRLGVNARANSVWRRCFATPSP